MHYNTHDSFLTAAFRTVKATDPDLYRRMVADNWTVTTDYDTAFSVVTAADGTRMSDDFMAWAEINDPGTYGATVSDNEPGVSTPNPRCFINRASILGVARYKHVDPVEWTAGVLAHEFAHTHQTDNDERVAFKAGAAFALKLGTKTGRAFASMSRQEYAHLASDGNYAWKSDAA